MIPSLPGSYLVLETTNQCSLACVHCTVAEGTSHPHHARVGFLDLALAEAVFADLVATRARFDALIPFWLGEPLLHPEFGAIYRAGLRAAADGVFQRVELHTNATHLGRDRIRVALNDSPVRQTWHFSIDAATAATYRRVKGRDSLAEVEANIEAFLDARARVGARWPRPVLQFIVGENNEDEAEPFRDRWTSAFARRGLPMRTAAQSVPSGDDAVVFLRQLDAPTPGEQERANAAFRRVCGRLGVALPRAEQTPLAVAPGPGICGCFWKSPVVGWDGTVTTCTRDNRLQNALGNVRDSPLSTIWGGGAMWAARQRVAMGDYSGKAACSGCFIPRSANYSGITVDEIASVAHASGWAS